MRFLHTSDWHLGKALRGQSRLEEQAAVCDEIVGIARERSVDLVLVAGDVFETAMPPPEAQRLAWSTLLALRDGGAQVVVVAGNHDNPLVFEALRPLAGAAGITVLGRPSRPEEGGVLELSCGGEPVRVALLPFLSQRGIVRSLELLAGDAAAHAGVYAERARAVLGALTAGFDETSVNLVLAHLMVRGGRLGGGERDAQTIEDYWVDPTAFPGGAHYVALGHLHLAQRIGGSCPIWYSGSPIQVDFGEEGDGKHVLVVEAHPGRPASAPELVPLSSPRRLRSLHGTLAELRALVGTTGADLLRVFVRERTRAGLAEEVRDLFPNAVDVYIDAPTEEGGGAPARRAGLRSPHQLFADFLAGQGVEDERVTALFARLLDEETSAVAGE
jgi:exonuclease SbcD